jgi:excisionase family DNA binding protein
MSNTPQTDTRDPQMHAQQRHLLLTVDEVADLLRTTRKAVYAMAERRQLPGVTRLGRRLLVRSDLLLDWLGQKRTPSFER